MLERRPDGVDRKLSHLAQEQGVQAVIFFRDPDARPESLISPICSISATARRFLLPQTAPLLKLSSISCSTAPTGEPSLPGPGPLISCAFQIPAFARKGDTGSLAMGLPSM